MRTVITDDFADKFDYEDEAARYRVAYLAELNKLASVITQNAARDAFTRLQEQAAASLALRGE